MIRARYVVLRHEGMGEAHFDLMFEQGPGSMLTAWRSERWPIGEPTQLVRLADHRAVYLAYEGEISGGRGYVRRVEEGEYESEEAVNAEGWEVRLRPAGRAVEVLRFAVKGGVWWAEAERT